MKAPLVLALVVACTPKTWRPPIDAGSVAVQHDAIVRAEYDGTTSITVFERLEGRVAAGTVWLRGIDPRSAAASPHVVLAHARAWQALAVMSTTPDDAFEAARRGSESLAAETPEDDRFERGARETRTTNLELAVEFMQHALRFRLHDYVQRHRDVVPSGKRDDTDNAIIANRAIARSEPDGTISVTTLVSLDGVTAAGTIRLRGTPLESSRAWDHVAVARARAWQALSLMLTDPAQAYEAALNGTKAIFGYNDHNHLKFAEASRNLEATRRILRSQIDWYVFHHHDEVW